MSFEARNRHRSQKFWACDSAPVDARKHFKKAHLPAGSKLLLHNFQGINLRR